MHTLDMCTGQSSRLRFERICCILPYLNNPIFYLLMVDVQYAADQTESRFSIQYEFECFSSNGTLIP